LWERGIGGALCTAGHDREDQRPRVGWDIDGNHTSRIQPSVSNGRSFFGKQTRLQYNLLRWDRTFPIYVFWKHLWVIWIPYNRNTSISVPPSSGNSSVTMMLSFLVFLFKPCVGARHFSSACNAPPNAHTHTLMLVLKPTNYISERSSIGHDLDRFTTLGTMLSCTVYG